MSKRKPTFNERLETLVSEATDEQLLRIRDLSASQVRISEARKARQEAEAKSAQGKLDGVK